MLTYEDGKNGGEVESNASIVNHLDLLDVVATFIPNRQEEEDRDSRGGGQHRYQPEDPSPTETLNECAAEKRASSVCHGDDGTHDTFVC